MCGSCSRRPKDSTKAQLKIPQLYNNVDFCQLCTTIMLMNAAGPSYVTAAAHVQEQLGLTGATHDRRVTPPLFVYKVYRLSPTAKKVSQVTEVV
jgi:hypothetical protein